jgi:hypothetical protein
MSEKCMWEKSVYKPKGYDEYETESSWYVGCTNRIYEEILDKCPYCGKEIEEVEG